MSRILCTRNLIKEIEATIFFTNRSQVRKRTISIRVRCLCVNKNHFRIIALLLETTFNWSIPLFVSFSILRCRAHDRAPWWQSYRKENRATLCSLVPLVSGGVRPQHCPKFSIERDAFHERRLREKLSGRQNVTRSDDASWSLKCISVALSGSAGRFAVEVYERGVTMLRATTLYARNHAGERSLYCEPTTSTYHLSPAEGHTRNRSIDLVYGHIDDTPRRLCQPIIRGNENALISRNMLLPPLE